MPQVAIGESIFLRLHQQLVGQLRSPVLENLLFQVNQFLHLFNKPRLDVSLRVEVLYGCTFAQRFVHDELSLAGRLSQQFHQFIQGPLMEILGKAKSISAVLQRTD